MEQKKTFIEKIASQVIDYIQNKELGYSVRAKINAIIQFIKNTAATKEDIANLSQGLVMGMLYLEFDVNTPSALTKPTIKNPETGEIITLLRGHSTKVLDQVDEKGNPYYYQYDGERWNKTNLTALPSDVALAGGSNNTIKNIENIINYSTDTNHWLRDKKADYNLSELIAIKRITDIKIYVTNILDTDIYTINGLRKTSETMAQLIIYKNGASFLTIPIELDKQEYTHSGTIEIFYNWTENNVDLNVTNSQIIISKSAIIDKLSYLKSLSYELIDRNVDEYGNIITAGIRWSDGSGGNYAVTDFNKDFVCYDGYTAYHTNSTKAIKQPKIARNEIGVVINKPELIII